jgi:hypothetical protein
MVAAVWPGERFRTTDHHGASVPRGQVVDPLPPRAARTAEFEAEPGEGRIPCVHCQRRRARYWYRPAECWLCFPCLVAVRKLRDRLTDDGLAPPAEYACVHGEEGWCDDCDGDPGGGER